jgi:uncharacterized membrane protein YgdD (TMEM256/DUF423 family)
MNQRGFLITAGILGALAVTLGAMAAHALEKRLSVEALEWFETGAKYHMYHALALLALSLGPAKLWDARATRVAGWAWIAGIILFSGSLYALALTEIRALGAITPFGGVAFITGWIAVAFAARKVAANN